jgi:hypothetical protein
MSSSIGSVEIDDGVGSQENRERCYVVGIDQPFDRLIFRRHSLFLVDSLSGRLRPALEYPLNDGDMLHLNTASPIRAGKEMNSFPTWKRAEPCANPAALRVFGRQRLIPGAGNAGDFGLSAFLHAH